MQFKEKLDYLMTLTKTSNSHLAKISSLDNSYVSRLRNGSRRLPKKENYTLSFANYFAKSICSDQLKTMLCHIMSIDYNELPDDESDLASLIHSWLTEENKNAISLVNTYLHELKVKIQFNTPEINHIELRYGYKHEVESYLGPNGNSDALINFLKIATTYKDPNKLFIFEDNNTILFYKPNFKNMYFALLKQLVNQGYKISVVFNINKPAEETLPVITSWLPLLTTGAVKAYYYPRYRDQVFNHHLLFIPRQMALVRNNFYDAVEKSITTIYTDKIILASYEIECEYFLKQCYLLSTIVDSSSHKGYLEPLLWYDTQMEDSIIKTPCLTSMTMPSSLVEKIFNTVNHKDKAAYLKFHHKRAPKFEEYLKHQCYIEIIELPTIEDILEGKVLISYPDTFGIKERYYTPEEFCLHLRNVIYLLKTYPNYDIYFASGLQSDDISIEVRENTGVIFAKYSKTAVYFLIMEPTTTSIFNNYLHDIIHFLPSKNKNKKEVLATLETLFNKLIKIKH